MTDRSYLKQRGTRWYFQIAVPKDLQKAVGKAVIIEPLHTSDLRDAQRLRWEKRASAETTFARLRGKKSLTSAEIEHEAQSHFRALLAEAAEARARGHNPYAMEPEETPPGHEEIHHDATEEGLLHHGDMVSDALHQDDIGAMRGYAAEIIEKTGADIPEGSDRYRELCRALLRSRLEAFRAMTALHRGRAYQPEQPFNVAIIDPVTLEARITPPTRGRRSKNGEDSFSKTAATFVSEMMRDPDAGWTNQTKGQYETTFRLFASFVKEAPLPSIEREDISGFLDALAKLRKDWGRSPDTKNRTIWYLLEHHAGAPGLTNTTLNRHLTALSGLYKWAKKRSRELRDKENPCSGLMRARGRRSVTGYKPFNLDELKKIFGSPLFHVPYKQRISPAKHDMKSAISWASLISLFSGMREGEVCHLRTADVRSEGGVWYFDVVDEGPDQRTKTEAGIRKVPIHSQLIRAGFLEYLKSAEKYPSGQLFPGLKRGGPDKKINWYFSKAFTRFRRDLGVDRPGATTFHSFRKNVGTALERARVPESEAVQIIGHEKMSMSYTVYSLGLELKALHENVEKIVYDGLDLRHLEAPRIGEHRAQKTKAA